ncbi:response regulator [Pseudocolwellia sp. AS88]|uniref:response regulator n=1 Tax=Pseudocolwellia sp. AS88 TaxID=3063958 RepID=UPI0026EF3717|nr:response regulator [Pseudocolwellia sp. AS88]MDO7085432.1 response regulator [Pseudocolwellia sp. AS88]
MDEISQNNKNKRSLRVSLCIWFLIISLLPLTLNSIFNYYQAKSILTTQAEKELAQSSELIKLYITDWFDDRYNDAKTQAKSSKNVLLLSELKKSWQSSNTDLKNYINSEQWRQVTQAHQNELISFKQASQYIDDVYLIDNEGNVIFSLANKGNFGDNVFSSRLATTKLSKAIQETLSTQATTFSDLERNINPNKRLTAFITSPVLNANQELIGALAIELSLERLFKIFRESKDEHNPIVHYMIGQDARLRSPLHNSLNDVLNEKISNACVTEWVSTVNTDNSSTNSEKTHSNIDEGTIHIHSTIKIGNISWGLISAKDEYDVLSASSAMLNTLIISILFTIVVVLIVSILMARRFTKPIYLLAKASQNFAKGNIEHLHVQQSSKEMSQLFASFNEMLKIKQSHEKQLESNNELIQIKLNVTAALSEQAPFENKIVKALSSVLQIKNVQGTSFSGVLIFENETEYFPEKHDFLKWYSEAHLTKNEENQLKAFASQSMKNIGTDKVQHLFIVEINNANFHYLAPIYNLGSNNIVLGFIVFSSVDELKHYEEGFLTICEMSDLFSAAITQNNAHHLLKKASSIAQQNNNLKSEFLASMSHEIRTPMNGVLGMLGLLLNSGLSTTQIEKAKLAKSSAQSLLVIINDILDFSKVEAGKLELELIDFDLREMLGNFSKAIAFNAQNKGVELILDIKNIEHSKVRGDSGRIRQILTNLVSNAIKFTASGEILITASTSETQEGKLILSCSVSDTGIGIPEDKLLLLFEQFSQVDNSTTRKFGGTGLGLAITKKLCELMNGNIKAHSKLGEGSQFHFTIEILTSAQSTRVYPEFDITPLHILIVDNNLTNREVINSQLSLWGANTYQAGSEEQAINICRDFTLNHQGRIFDLLLIDTKICEIKDNQLISELKKQFDDINVVMMTPISSDDDSPIFTNYIFNQNFVKPVTTQDLLYALNTVFQNKSGPQPVEFIKPIKPIEAIDGEDELINTSSKQYAWPDNIRLLIVEDNRINQHVALGILKEFNLTADIAINGLEAISVIKEASKTKPYSLVLMDCQMPEMDGYDATQAIRAGQAGKKNKDLVILAMTANAMEGDKENCINVGMNDYLSKPINPNLLLQKLQYWLLTKNGLVTKNFIKQEKLIIKNETVEHTAKPTASNKANITWEKKSALKRVKGNKKLLNKLISLFLEDMPKNIEHLQISISEKNIIDIAALTHSIKGATGNLSANKMHTLTKKIEKLILNDIEGIDFNELETEVSALANEYKTLEVIFSQQIEEDRSLED